MSNIWSHVTTEENWESIKKDGFIDPNRAESFGPKATTLFKDHGRIEALDTITYPFWVTRKTRGYVLLHIDGDKLGIKTKRDFYEFPDKITLDAIIDDKKIGKTKITEPRIFKKGKVIAGVVKMEGKSKSSSYGRNQERPYLPVVRLSNNIANQYLGVDNPNLKQLKKSISALFAGGMNKETADEVVDKLKSIGFKPYNGESLFESRIMGFDEFVCDRSI